MSRRARLLAAAMVAALVAVLLGAAPQAAAVPASLNLAVPAPLFVGETFTAQSDPMPTPGGRSSWTCHVDFGDGTTGGFWRAPEHDPVAPCAEHHQYQAPGTYAVTMTVTDNAGGTVTEQRQVTVSTREVTPRDAGVEGSRVVLGAAEADTTWTLVGPAASRSCDLGRQPAARIAMTCHRDGTYRIHFDTDDAATSGAYLVTWTNGAPQPTVRAVRTQVRSDGTPALVPVRRIGTGDEVRFDVRAHDPSTHGTQGDPLRCVFDHGNGQREKQAAYAPQGSCNGLTSYLAPGRHTSRVRVTDDDGAIGRARASVVVIRRDVHVSVRDIRRGGTSGVIRAHLTPRGMFGRVALRFPDNQSLVATKLTSISVTRAGSVRIQGRARVDGEAGYRFVVFPDTGYPQGLAFLAYAWRLDAPDEYVVNQAVRRSEYRVRLHAPPVS